VKIIKILLVYLIFMALIGCQPPEEVLRVVIIPSGDAATASETGKSFFTFQLCDGSPRGRHRTSGCRH